MATIIDRRRKYIMVVDTETANGQMINGKLNLQDSLVYDCGFCIMDTKGNVYEEHSYINGDVFFYEPDLMQSSYYAEKIPVYISDLDSGTRKLSNTFGIREKMLNCIEKYGINTIMAHNASFDVRALNNTIKWFSKSAVRYWFPYGIEVWDTMKMAKSIIHKSPTYKAFCERYDLFTPTGRLSTTAENLYRFIIKDPDFVESHTGLEDVQIEREIFIYCARQKKKMDKVLYSAKVSEPMTELQKIIWKNVKKSIDR